MKAISKDKENKDCVDKVSIIMSTTFENGLYKAKHGYY